MADYSTIGALIGVKSCQNKARRKSVLSSEQIRPGVPFIEEAFHNVFMFALHTRFGAPQGKIAVLVCQGKLYPQHQYH
jgi:hypothetical protein